MGAMGCSGVDSALLKSCLLRYGKASSELREELLDWTWWLANPLPPLAAYRAMRQGRLISLDKQPGVWPVGIGECWMRAVSKLVLADCAKEGKAACGSNQLCAGLEAGIEGAIHSVRKKAYEDWLMDLRSGRSTMICDRLLLRLVRHHHRTHLGRNPSRMQLSLSRTSKTSFFLCLQMLTTASTT